MGPQQLLSDESGLTTTEYLIILILIGIAGFATWAAFGEAVVTRIEPSSSIHVDHVVA